MAASCYLFVKCIRSASACSQTVSLGPAPPAVQFEDDWREDSTATAGRRLLREESGAAGQLIAMRCAWKCLVADLPELPA